MSQHPTVPTTTNQDDTNVVRRFDISSFKSTIAAHGGFTRGYFFACRLPVIPPNQVVRDVEMLCKAAQLPQSVVESTELHYFSRGVKIPSRRTFPSLTLTFFGTGHYDIRLALDRWQQALYDPRLNSRGHVNDDTPLTADIFLDHFDITGTQGVIGALLSGTGVFDALIRPEHRRIATYQCYDAFPVNISTMVFDMDNEQMQTFDVEFQYQSMTIDATGDPASTQRP